MAQADEKRMFRRLDPAVHAFDCAAGRCPRSCGPVEKLAPMGPDRRAGWFGLSEAKVVAQMHRVVAVIYAAPGIGWGRRHPGRPPVPPTAG